MSPMNKDKVISFFGGVRKTARAFNLTTQAVYAWDSTLSEGNALKAEKLSKGKLKYDASNYALD